MGVKEVLYRTKHLGWGTGTYIYRTIEEFASAFPPLLRSFGPRVIKQNRGNGGQGVWKVEILPGKTRTIRVLDAQLGSIPEELSLQTSSRAANLISAGAGASSTSRFRCVCPMG